MERIQLKDVFTVYLNILEAFDALCEKYQLKYTVFYGTMIGAIRHKGFIPWDDDVDVAMPREDYEKLVAMIPSLSQERYKPMCNRSHPKLNTKICYMVDSETQVRYSYRKEANPLSMIHIDVYPIDQIPNDKAAYTKIIKRQRRLIKWFELRCISVDYPRSSKLKKALAYIVKKCVSFASPHTILKVLDKGARKYSLNSKVDHSNDLAYILTIMTKQKPFSAACLDEYITVDFEHLKVKCLAEYDTVLRAIYGDYMQLPPEDKRKPAGNPYRELYINTQKGSEV